MMIMTKMIRRITKVSDIILPKDQCLMEHTDPTRVESAGTFRSLNIICDNAQINIMSKNILNYQQIKPAECESHTKGFVPSSTKTVTIFTLFCF